MVYPAYGGSYQQPYINFPGINIQARSWNAGFAAERGSAYGCNTGSASTRAIGEEGGCFPEPACYNPYECATTQAVGEEGGGYPGDITTLAVGEEGGGHPPITLFYCEDGGEGDVSKATVDYLRVAAEADNNRSGRIGSAEVGDGKLTEVELDNQIATYNKQRSIIDKLSDIFSAFNPYYAKLFDQLDAKIAGKLKVAERIKTNFATFDKANTSNTADGSTNRKEILDVARNDDNVWDISDEDLGIVT